MSRPVALALLLAGSCVLGFAARLEAAPPWTSLVPFTRIDADPRKSYALTESQGPWMILAANFSGEGCQQHAQELVIELRKRYKLETYTYQRHFDDSQPQVGLGLNKYGERKMMKPANPLKFDEVAVLVGSYSSVEDSRAQKALQTLKYANPEALDLRKRMKEGKSNTQSLAVLRQAQKVVHEVAPQISAKKKGSFIRSKQAEMGPMRSAIITRNPLIPEEYFRQAGVDKLVLSMNEGVEYSLLDCPGQYSVRVATFRGKDTMLLKEIDQLEKDKAVSEKLVKGAEKAHELTVALRKKGYEAYEFHDRHESIVAIGSFDSVGEPREDGKTEINPAMHQTIETFKARQQNISGLAGAAMRPQLLNGIAFDAQPMPIAVPKRSSGADYSRGE